MASSPLIGYLSAQQDLCCPPVLNWISQAAKNKLCKAFMLFIQFVGNDLVWPEQTISIGIRRSVIWSRSIERHCSWTLAVLVVLTSRNDCCEYQHHPHHLQNLWPMLSSVYHSVHCTHSLSCTGIYWKTLWLSKGRGIYWEVLCWPQRSCISIVS